MNMNQAIVAVHNMEQAVRFYTTLGLIQIVENDHYARFAFPDGESTFSVYLDPGKQFVECRAVIYFEHERLDELVSTLKKKGLEFDQEPSVQPYLWKEAILTDPSGNKIKLYWAGENRLNPPWKLGS
ncbi:VOC family protein [Vibrio ponticus]|uniref:VOC family protein n=1 Tax=Vibrio ponticus TaxID=265668 RepID=A0A3N3DX01_9VIBR|nr:VOC family protein [Vibrio ponticus]ROV58956.1 VOC family protein [Vibrio ponticus]